ncbi:MAG: hypothetical protein AAF467_17950 [Actinomycetota bacterium]
MAPPYYALRDLADLGGGLATATVVRQAPVLPEHDLVEAAQVARHLAILGSCAAALARENDRRHHYLATRAIYRRLAPEELSHLDSPDLIAEAQATWHDKRSASAMMTLRSSNGTGLYALDVDYAVLPPKIFARLHPDHAAAGDVDLDAEAEADAFGTDTGRRIDGGWEVDCGPIPVGLCAGHFPGIPAAPVALLMGRLCRTAGLALADYMEEPTRYRIEYGEVEADRLARAGQRLVLRARRGDRRPDGHTFDCEALADDEVVGRCHVVLSAHLDDHVPGEA